MFRVGEWILHSNEGVCKVAAVGKLEFDNAETGTLYYTLEPYYGTGQLYTPVDSPVFMRPALTKQQAEELINQIAEITADPDQQIIPNTLCDLYKSCIQTEDCNALAAFIRHLLDRREANLLNGRKPPKIEDNYIKRAQDFLCDELAAVLETTQEEVKQRIIAAMCPPEEETQETENS
jgi:CarD family transcriptional regulator